MTKCSLFEKCGGCKFDFTADDYRSKKIELLNKVSITNDFIWIEPGHRRRADFAFLNNQFGFFEKGSKNIVPVKYCPLLSPELNKFVLMISQLPFAGSGSVLITECDNGIDVAINSGVPYFNAEFKKAAERLPAIRITWNERIINQSHKPIIKFGDKVIEYPSNAFLQPSQQGETELRNLVVNAATGSSKIADLFCGFGSFTFALKATGYDISGIGINRDLLKKPLTVRELNKFDCVVMDPPRSGAESQSKQLSKSDVKKIIYVSCSPDTFMRDKNILENGGFKLVSLTPVDQFVGSSNWELVGVFQK